MHSIKIRGIYPVTFIIGINALCFMHFIVCLASKYTVLMAGHEFG